MLEIIKLDNTIKLDIRYARSDNFIGRAVYDEARAFLQPVAAEALVCAHRRLAESGFGLVIFDGYRPWSVTKLFWELVSEEQRIFVANPDDGSKHNRGCAVDLSMFHIDSGQICEMPSDFDEFNEKAFSDYLGGTPNATKNREILRNAMEAHGFIVNPFEWWHFDHSDWRNYEIENVSFNSL